MSLQMNEFFVDKEQVAKVKKFCSYFLEILVSLHFNLRGDQPWNKLSRSKFPNTFWPKLCVLMKKKKKNSEKTGALQKHACKQPEYETLN